MYNLDVSTNEDYYDYELNQEVTGIAALKVYDYSLEYKTLIDEKFTGNEQRRDVWSQPRRTWSLEFQKDATLGRKLEDFFKAHLGRRTAFRFKWVKENSDGEDMGGDDNWYYVRFNTDKYSTQIDYYGYRHTTLEIIEVRNNI